MTFLEMQTRVGDLINQSVTDDTQFITETEVKAFLNFGYKKIVNRLSNTGQGFFARKSTFDLVADQQLYGLPDDFRKMVRLELGYDSASNLYKADHLDLNAFNDPVDTVSYESNPRYMIRGDNIDIYPAPSKNVTNGGVIYYIENPADLSGDSDESKLPLEFDDLPIYFAVAKAKAKMGLMDEYQIYMAEFERELQNMVDDIVSRSIDDNDRVIIRNPYDSIY